MTIGLLGALVLFLVGCFTGFVTGVFYSRKTILKAEKVYREAQTLLIVAQLVLKAVEKQAGPATDEKPTVNTP